MKLSYLEEKIHAADPSAPLGTSNNPSNRVLTVANAVTVCRIALTLVFLWLFVTGADRVLCLVIYAVAALTDFVDGQIARRTQTVSWFGKLLDPAVDRFLLVTGVLGLCIVGDLPVWVPVVLIGRDIVLAVGMAVVRRYRRRPVDVLYIGKVATALLLAGFSWLLLDMPVLPGFGLVDVPWLPLLNGQAACPAILVVYSGTVCSLITGVLYVVEGLQIRSEALEGDRTS